MIRTLRLYPLTWLLPLMILYVALSIRPAAAEDSPLTIEEAQAYVARFPADAAADVVKLDALEHAMPVVTLPRGILVETSRALGWTWAGPLELSIAGGVLAYSITLPTASARAPKPPWWPYIVAGGAGLVAGLLAGAWAATR